MSGWLAGPVRIIQEVRSLDDARECAEDIIRSAWNHGFTADLHVDAMNRLLSQVAALREPALAAPALPHLTWYPAGTGNPLDEQADLMAGYTAIIGPGDNSGFGWTVIGPDGEDVADGKEDDASLAKATVRQWFGQGIDYSTGRSAVPPPGLPRAPRREI